MTKPIQIQPLGTSAKWVRMFVIAMQGWGKTVFAGTAPNALFLTTDPEGTVSAKEFGSEAEEWSIAQWQDLEAAYRWLRDEGLESEGYQWLIIDNITEAQRLGMARSMEISKKMSNSPDKLDEFVPTQADYQRSQMMLTKMVLQFNDLPVHILYTSHLNGYEDAEGEPVFGAAIHGQKGALRNQIVGYANIVGMGESITAEDGKSEKRRLWFATKNAYRGKDRFQALGRFKDDLTIPEMMSIIETKQKRRKTSPKTSTKTPVAKTGSTTKSPARKRVAVKKTA